jgi:hypothetical protein
VRRDSRENNQGRGRESSVGKENTTQVDVDLRDRERSSYVLESSKIMIGMEKGGGIDTPS